MIVFLESVSVLCLFGLLACGIIMRPARKIGTYPRWTKHGHIIETMYGEDEYKLIKLDNASTILMKNHRIFEEGVNFYYVKRHLPEYLMEALL